MGTLYGKLCILGDVEALRSATYKPAHPCISLMEKGLSKVPKWVIIYLVDGDQYQATATENVSPDGTALSQLAQQPQSSP